MPLPLPTHLRRALAAAIAACVIGLPLVAAPAAHAGAYIHYTDCGHTNAADLRITSSPSDSDGNGWSARSSSAPGSGALFWCVGSNGLYGELQSTDATTIADGDWTGFNYKAPPSTKIIGFDTDWQSFTAPRSAGRQGATHAVVSRGYDLNAHYGQGGISGHLTNDVLEDTTLRFAAYCDAPGTVCWSNGVTSWVNILSPYVRLVDDVVPGVTTPTGVAVSDDTWKGSKDLSYSATDQGAGLARFRVYVDGILAIDRGLVNGGPYGPSCVSQGSRDGAWIYGWAKPCPDSISRTETLDTTQLPDGMHTISAKILDGAQNTTMIYSAAKHIANAPPVNTAAPAFLRAADAAAPVVAIPLTTNSGAWTGPNLGYTMGWEQCDASGVNCLQIPGATTVSYVPGSGDVGHRLRFAVTATNAAASVTARSPMTGVVAAPSSAEPPTAKPTDGSNGAGGTGGPGGNAIVPPGLGVSVSNTAEHTFIGHVAGEPHGVPCPQDKATLTFEHVKGGQVKLGFGKASTAQLQLTCTNTGKAIADAKLEIATRTGEQAAVAADVTTDGDGHATLRLAAGANRAITVGYRMYADDALARAVATLKVLVAGKASLSASRKILHNGQAVTLKGRLAGGLVPRRGVTLAVQWKDGRRWRPFAQIKTDRRGTFRYAYRFTRTRNTVHYRLRVQVVRGQIDYPFLATNSTPVQVTVAP